MELRINRLDEFTHRTAKMLAAQQGISLNKFILDAITGHCFRMAHKTGLTERIIKMGYEHGENAEPQKPKRRI